MVSPTVARQNPGGARYILVLDRAGEEAPEEVIMATITTEQLLVARIHELHHCTWNDSRKIHQQIQEDATGKTWLLLDDHTYATVYDGKLGPAVLSFFHDEEASLVFSDHAEAVLDGYEVSVEVLREVVG
jgi:hypothetical protein